MLEFVCLERYNAVQLVRTVHASLAELNKVIRGNALLSSDVQKLASALLKNEVNFIIWNSTAISCVIVMQVPVAWYELWEGPEDPVQYLRSLVAKSLALGMWEEKGRGNSLLQGGALDLSELFHPDTFFNALRQQTARCVRVHVHACVCMLATCFALQDGAMQHGQPQVYLLVEVRGHPWSQALCQGWFSLFRRILDPLIWPPDWRCGLIPD